MKIDEIVKGSYSLGDIANKQAKMAKQLQIKWATDKKLFAQQNKPISIVDYIDRILPVIKKVNPDFGKNISNNLSIRDENNLIAYALDIALKATNYWQRQIEKNAGMDPSAYNAPTPKPTTATQANPQSSVKQPGFTAQASDGQTYKWLGAQWKNSVTGRIAKKSIAAELNGAHP